MDVDSRRRRKGKENKEKKKENVKERKMKKETTRAWITERVVAIDMNLRCREKINEKKKRSR